MSRLHFKGGAWTNAEDEVMKAALAQYGLRDWERVASMLTKKTATQCRERWENYLDPRLHIHEAWSLEEEEKLVEYQALFPHKWRLIAEQLTRRTPNHYIRPAWLCEQRYLELKDEQEYYLKEQQQQLKSVPGGAEGEKQSLESYMAERRRRRLARKTNEERAARADTVSGERFESEMVDMATSRLANQDQKKGLRKERQRQLAEAAFLAKLESNREGIESGTLSLRQSRKMKKALEEDRQTSGLVDGIREGEDDDEGDSLAGDAEDARDEEGERTPFRAIDMYEDQQQAGLVKKQRVLMKDLTKQQRLIQQRQMDSGAAEDDGVAADGKSTSDSSRARAALTGVNQDLLKQLTAAPAASAPALAGPSLRAITAASARPSITAAAAADAKAELHSSLSDLFATLPSANRTTTTSTVPPVATSSDADASMPPPLPLPPLKRPREALQRVSAAVDGQEEREVAGNAQGGPSHETARADSGVPADLFGALDLPAPRKHRKPDLADATSVPLTVSAVELRSTPSSAPAPVAMDAEEAALYVQDARCWVAVECERAASGSSASDPDAPTPTEVRRAQDLVHQELHSTYGPEDGAASREAASAMAAAVRAFTSAAAPAEYGAGVNVQHALHQLSQRVAAQVREANAVLRPLRQEWERVVSAAMLSPHDRHVLSGYVQGDGQLRGPAAAGARLSDDATGAPDGDGKESTLPAPSVAAYVYERLAGRLQRARVATRFTVELREREVLKMRRDLDEVEHDLQQAQARERTLQDMYRHKRAQQP